MNADASQLIGQAVAILGISGVMKAISDLAAEIPPDMVEDPDVEYWARAAGSDRWMKCPRSKKAYRYPLFGGRS